MNIVMICGAGKGVRLGKKIPKALVPLLKKPMFIWAIEVFLNNSIDHFLILAPNQHIAIFQQQIKKYLPIKIQKKIIGVIKGGLERQDSIFNGLLFLKNKNIPSNANLLVHNAGNLFIKKDEITKMFQTIKQGFGFASGLPSVDTLRTVNNQMQPQRTLKREEIWRMQTPQGAKFKTLLKAHQKASQQKIKATDDLELLNNIHHPTVIIPTNQLNFKITYKEDLRLAEMILKNRGYFF